MTAKRLLAASFGRRTGDSLMPAIALAADAFVVVLFLSVAFAPASASLAAGATIRNFFIACAILVAVFSCVFAWFVAGYFLGKRRRETATWMLLGMSRRTAFVLSAGELAISAAAAFATGFASALILRRFFALVLGYLMKAEGASVMPVTWRVAGLSAALFAAQLLAVASRGALEIRRTTIGELFASDRRVDGSPRFRLFFVALGAALLLAAYAAAALSAAPAAVVLMIPVLVSAVAGTFLLFEGLVPLLADGIRSRRGEADAAMLVAMAQLAFRRRRNARLLSLVSILVAVASTAGATMFVLASNASLQADRLCPNDVELSCSEPAAFDAEAARMNRAISESKPEKINFRTVDVLPVRLSFKGADSGVEADAIRHTDWRFLMLESGREYRGELPDGAIIVHGYLASRYPLRAAASVTVSVSGKTASGPLFIVDEGNALAPNRALHQIALPDREWARLAASSAQFRVAVWNSSAGIALRPSPPEDRRIRVSIRSEALGEYRRESGALLMIGVILTAAFLVAAVSVLAFKQLEDAMSDRDRFRLLHAVGMGESDMRRVAFIQVGLSFVLPFTLGGGHAVFALNMLAVLTRFRVAGPTVLVLAASAVAFTVFFLLILARYRRITIGDSEAFRTA